MIYIYDIVLNFNKDYFEFFQWKKGDKIINVKKIPAFRISDKDMMNLKYNSIRVSQDFIDKICDLTMFYNRNNNYKYLCLVSNGNESIGLLFDKNGYLLKRSSLVFDEENEVNDEIASSEVINIDYIQNNVKDIVYLSRIDKERKDYLFNYINKLDEDNDCDIFRYIYYDYFEEEEEDLNKIKNLILDLIKNNNCDKLFELVKVLKKIRN